MRIIILFLDRKTPTLQLVTRKHRNEGIRFINLVFDPRRDFDEWEAFDRYKELYLVFKERVKGVIPDELKIGFSTYSKMWPHIKKAVHSDLEEYLYDRYIQFSDYPNKMR